MPIIKIEIPERDPAIVHELQHRLLKSAIWHLYELDTAAATRRGRKLVEVPPVEESKIAVSVEEAQIDGEQWLRSVFGPDEG